jgi:hypothetical protein
MNDHPLANDLTKLTHDELENRLTKLTQRWYTAKRMNMNHDVMHQLDLLLQGIELEKQRRALPPDDGRRVMIDTDENLEKP